MSSKEIEQLWNDYFPKVFGYFYRRLNCREDVEDLTSVVMTRFIHSLSEYDIRNQNAYLWRIAHNQLANFYRDKSKAPVHVSLMEDDNLDWVNDKVEQTRSDAFQEKVHLLIRCAKLNLKGDDYVLVSEVVMEDKKSSEVAKEQGTNPATIRKRISRALSRLRDKCSSIWEDFQPKPNHSSDYAN